MKSLVLAAVVALAALAAPSLAQAPQVTPPRDPTVSPPSFSLQSLWNEIDCECDCPCCERIKQLIKQRLKDPDARPMPSREGRWYGRDRRRPREPMDEAAREKLHELRYEQRLELIDLRAALEKRELELEHLMRSKDPSEKELRKRVDAVAKARAEIEFRKLSARLEVRRLHDGSGGD